MQIKRRRWARVGPWIVVLGVAHVASAAVLYADSWASIIAGGVINSVESDPDQLFLRGSGFWFVTAGWGIIALGWLTDHVEQRIGSTPPALPLVLIGLGLWGVVLVPMSGFWAFFVLAVLAWICVRSDARTATPAGATT